MACAECSRLCADYKRLDGAFVIAFDRMLDACSASAVQFVLAQATADKCSIDCEVSWLELERHKLIHSSAN
jgi:hypothetical protein